MLPRKYLYLPWLMLNERRSRDELIHIQNVKLKRLIRHAYTNVGFYRETFKNMGIHPQDIRSVEDLSQLPIIDKKTFHQRDLSYFFDKRIMDRNRLINIKTSGTSGTNLSFYIDGKYDQYRKAIYLRPFLSNGRRITDKMIRFTIHSSEKWFQRIGLMRELRIDSSEDISRQINHIKKMRPQIIQGYPSTLALIASKISSDNIDLPRPRIVFTDSELLTLAMRSKIESSFDAPVIDIYGTFETDNIAYECFEHKGYHIAMDSVVMEFVKDGKSVKAGEEGEIVCTVLDNYAMPFIRYNLHDTACYLDEMCSCGRGFPLMSMLGGRSNDYLVYPDGTKRSHARLLGHFALLADAVSEIQIVQKGIDMFDVKIVLLTSFPEDIEHRVRQSIWKEFPGADVSVKFVNKIQRERSGKFRSIKSLIN